LATWPTRRQATSRLPFRPRPLQRAEDCTHGANWSSFINSRSPRAICAPVTTSRRQLYFISAAQGRRKQIPLVVDAELLSSDREWRTGQTARQQINPLVGATVEVRQILFAYIPPWPVQPQRVAKGPFDFDKGLMAEASLFQWPS
jgi:hypothetical protein